jgi:hypothetical protein
MRLRGASLVLALAVAGCHSPDEQQPTVLPIRGPARTLRVALDPYLAEPTIARTLAGPFRLVSRSRDRVVVARTGLTIVFRRLDAFSAVRAFRRGQLDEAPVPQGEIRAFEADDVLGRTLHARVLDGLDVVVFDPRVPRAVRRAYWLTAPRGEYQGLIPERIAPAAFALLPGADETSAADARSARSSIRELPRVPVRLAVANRPEIVEAAEIPWAEWRQLGLPVTLVPGGKKAEARFVRATSRKALSELRQRSGADRPEVALIVPLARVAEARLVSPRVRGWRMDAHGVVDYSRVSLETRP